MNERCWLRRRQRDATQRTPFTSTLATKRGLRRIEVSPLNAKHKSDRQSKPVFASPTTVRFVHIYLTFGTMKSFILVAAFVFFFEAVYCQRVVRVRGRQRAIAAAPPPQANTQQLGQCPEPEGLQLFEDPNSCHNFFKCANGTLTYETCENGLLFDAATGLAGAAHNHCGYEWAVNCGERPVDRTPIPGQRGCDYQFGIFEETPCSPNYIKCAFGVSVITPCDIGLVYDPRSHSCNWPDQQLDLGCNPSALLGGFQCPSHPDQLSPLARRFFPFPRFAVEGQPGFYILCVNGHPRLQACAGGAGLFDPATLSCAQPEGF